MTERPVRVLFVEQSPGLGGSTVALGRLLRHLPPRYAPVVSVQHDIQETHLRSLGIEGLDVVRAPVIGAFPTESPERRPLLLRALGAFAALRYQRARHGPAAAALREVIRGREIGLVHLNNTLSSNLGGWWAARREGVPCVVKQRGYEWKSLSLRFAARSVRAFMADSEHVAADLVASGIPRRKIVVTYAPIDVEDIDARSGPDARAAARREFGIPGGAPAFGILGCLQRWKGQSVFLDAAAAVMREVPDAVALVIGGGDEHFEPGYGAELRAQAERLGIADRVRFTGHRSDVPRVLSALDACVHASLEAEPFGMVVGEAMAARLPVVASSAGGPAEQVVEGETGFLVAPQDADAIAARLVRLLRDPALRAAMGGRGRERVAERFSAAAHARATAAVYDDVLSRR
ncbi:MAG: D-inositol-3-phosphate glycosyltransferase [Planctomycetes bacterium]|nr:D-inositol-3-phosphate glycosyltransferase [Planctomycetota bacterium]